jgi:hypothetical protein
VGSLSSSSAAIATTSSSNVAVITTAVMAADLPVLSTMLSRLFESSRYLDDVALHHLIDALCKLSHEAMELAYCNRVKKIYYYDYLCLMLCTNYYLSIYNLINYVHV